jgi:hypothetical protein
MFDNACVDEELQQVGQNDIDLNVADIARARARRDLAQVVQPQHQ